MYSQQPSNVPTRLQSNSTNRRKPRFTSRLTKFFCNKALSCAMAGILVVLSLSTGILAANIADKGMDVGFEPEYQNSTKNHTSDNALFGQYSDVVNVKVTFHGSKEMTVYCAPVTVGELLAKLSLTLDENDEVSQDLSAEIKDGMHVKVDRLGEETRTETEEIPYETKTVENSKLEKGKTTVKQKGVNGKLEKTILEKYVNGELVSSEVTHEETILAPVEEIVEVGTYVAPAAAKPKTTTTASAAKSTGSSSDNTATKVYTDCYGNSYKYSYYIDVIATAYGYNAGNITATGKPVAKGIFACSPKVIPSGTRCYITGVPSGTYGDMGVMVNEDCGAFSGNRIDIFLGDENDCIQFGRRAMRVYILA